MEYEHQLSNLIYDYLLNRFRFGYYQYGDSLPTVDVFCRLFNVSAHPIWTALRRLRADGYIDMKNGRISKVIYKQTEQERRDVVIDYFSQRWTSYLDIYRTSKWFYVPFMIEGFRRMDEKDISYITQLVERADADDVILLYSFTMQKVRNSLLMNLYWETSLFLGYPFAKSGFRPYGYDPELGRQQLRHLVQLVKEGSWDNVRSILLHHQKSVMDRLIVNMEPLIRRIPDQEQISFVWRIYNGHPQVCYDLSYRLLHEMYMGEYRNKEFLPSYEKMAERFGVSVSTARRTISMLNRIGAAESINGKGTRILSTGECSSPDFTSPVIRRNLSYLVQSLELLIHTCEEVSYHFFEHLLPEEREELISRFEENRCFGRGRLSIDTYLYYISRYSRIQVVRQIYGTVYGLFLWGYPRRISRGAESAMIQRGVDFTASMIQFMKENKTEQCVAAVKTYIQEEQPYGIHYLEQHGIAEEELRNSAPIRLLIAGE